MLSKTCEYALRAVIYIAAEGSKDAKVGIAEICTKIEAPKHFSAKILQVLVHSNLVSSQKGLNGGFYLDSAQLKNTLKDVVNAIDGDKLFTGCGLGLKECSEKEPCPLHNKFKSIRNNIRKMLEGSTIGEMAQKIRIGSSFLKVEAQLKTKRS